MRVHSDSNGPAFAQTLLFRGINSLGKRFQSGKYEKCNIVISTSEFYRCTFVCVCVCAYFGLYLESSPHHSPGFASGIAACISPLLFHVKEKIVPQSAH